ncbi:MAG TPA: nuclear transport factor 2 family protein [Candidatus Angelobacter sp.]
MRTNLEIIKSIYLGDAEESKRNLQSILSPDVEWTEAAGFPYAGTYHGVEEVGKNVFARLASEWIGFRADVANFYDAGDTIIATGFYRAAYRPTGKPMEASFAHVWTLKSGKIVKYVQYADTRKVWEAM